MTRVGTLILRQFPEKNPNLPQAAGTNKVQKPPRTHTWVQWKKTHGCWGYVGVS